MSVQQRVNVYLRHRLHTLHQQDYLTSQEISQALGGGSNATPINQALLKLMGIGHVTRRMRPPSNTYEWRATTAVTKAPTPAELQCLPPELLVQLDKAEAALATPAPIERRPIPTVAEVQRVGLPTVVVPAPTFGPPAPQSAELESPALSQSEQPKPVSDRVVLVPPLGATSAETEPDMYERTKHYTEETPIRTWIKGADDREAQAAEFRADVTAAALEAPECAEAPPAKPDPITTLSDVLERYRARQYDRLTIDDAAIIEIAREILQRQQVPAVFVSAPNDHGPYASGIYVAFSEFPLQVRDYFAPEMVLPQRISIRSEIDALGSAMDSVLSQLAQPKRTQVHVPAHVLWALATLGPALPPPIAAVLAEAHAILSQPLLTESEPAA